MKIDGKFLKEQVENIFHPEACKKRKLVYDMNTLYEGGGRDLIKAKLRQEFSDADAIKELEGRLTTINIMKKIIDKSAGVYVEAPTRSVVDDSESDSELLELYEDSLRLNMVQKECNRHLKMYKRFLKKYYVDSNGRPRILVKPAHSYVVIHVDNPDPVEPDCIVEIIHEVDDKEKCILHWWSTESFWITNGKGEVILEDMVALNQSGINPVGKMPFNYRVASSSEIDPIIEDDLYHASISIPIVLSDLYYAVKYQCWSIIYTVNADASDVKIQPSSLLNLKGDPGQDVKIGQVKPEVDIDDVIKLIESTINLLLSSRGLSQGVISTGQSAKAVESGVSKILDSADVISDKKDQQDLFIIDESDMWDNLAFNQVPYWRKQRLLNNKFNREFTSAFVVAVVFKEPKALVSERDRTEIGIKKIDAGLMSRKKFIQDDNPDWTDSQVEDYIREIDEEKKAKVEKPDESDDTDEDGKKKTQPPIQNKPNQDV